MVDLGKALGDKEKEMTIVRWDENNVAVMGVFDLRGAKGQKGQIRSDWHSLVGAWEWRADEEVLLLTLLPDGEWPNEGGMDILTEELRCEVEGWRGHSRLRDALLVAPDKKR